MGATPRIQLPPYVRCLCLLIMALLIVSTCVEMFMIVQPWVQGAAYDAIVASYREYYPELKAYAAPQQGWAIGATLLLDMLVYLPYYAALLCGAGLFYQFFRGNVWQRNNMLLLQIIGILLIVDVLFPSLAGLLQIMVLTAGEKMLFIIYYGVNSESVRSLIVGCAILVFSRVFLEALRLNEEQLSFV
ncbi:DUF2975 domain-containing protein [Serratia ficaria]|uniref:Protein of uncharacterized function (DUF2975) n=1 Tax=Serratia ficaria TaxID=61651 RepID=A0A240BV62_SERFI|nr:DUF2975 domain-containing protein [Serratia ficaria]MEE4484256.1 DUF2975 domain-containing protein [Serratia ficaria]REF45218.1 DUF2975 family protein [Serratia ficaria]CAI0828900.1 Protein of uncharacterised function (DUF2975) [Serratia ficaria]CAI0871201.1 Protein of uncharacterised function (DUF2975) [Serratia ficaria]CAI0909698.1 Protein of uncharacterised function (DUF2975) [Serratia ficaria]